MASAIPSAGNGEIEDVDREPTAVLPRRIRVMVRIRPLIDFERGHASSFLSVDQTRRSLLIATNGNDEARRSFAFDQVFDGATSQQELYEQMGFPAMLTAVLDGYHATVFAYGQTGSGKTYTMEGYEYEASGITDVGTNNSRARVRLKTTVNAAASEHTGLIPRVITHLFELIAESTSSEREFTVHCSFVQIYNERILDLLNPSHLQPGSRRTGRQNAPGLRLRWTAARKFYVENLRILECTSPSQVLGYFQEGVRHKVMASHRLNAASSRSHCLFTLYVESRDPNSGDGFVTQSKLTLVDLAGSERVNKTGASGVTLKESIGINKSLFVLRQVIQALSGDEEGDENNVPTGNKSSGADSRAYIPYRDSKLTSLLNESLGGNSLTLMVACLSPSDAHVDENMSTLVYAARAQRISTRPTKNADPRAALIEELRSEVAALKQQLTQAREVILGFQGATALLPSNQQPHLQTDRPGCADYKHHKLEDSKSRSTRPAKAQQQEADTQPRMTDMSPSVPTSKAAIKTATVAPGATQDLKLKVIDSVSLVKRMYATEKRLSDLVEDQTKRIGVLQHESHVLTVENQSLREKMEVLEYLVAHQSSENQGGKIVEEPDEDVETNIPGYGLLSRIPTRFSSSSSSPSLFPVPPTTQRIQDVLRGQRSSSGCKAISPGSRRRESGQNCASLSSEAGESNSSMKHSRRRTNQVEAGLLSFDELKNLLGGKKPPSAPTGLTHSIGHGIGQSQRQFAGQTDRIHFSASPNLRFRRESSTAPARPATSSPLDLDPLDSLSELSRLLRVKAALRQGTNSI